VMPCSRGVAAVGGGGPVAGARDRADEVEAGWGVIGFIGFIGFVGVIGFVGDGGGGVAEGRGPRATLLPAAPSTGRATGWIGRRFAVEIEVRFLARARRPRHSAAAHARSTSIVLSLGTIAGLPCGAAGGRPTP